MHRRRRDAPHPALLVAAGFLLAGIPILTMHMLG
jgi:hypothetical protein